MGSFFGKTMASKRHGLIGFAALIFLGSTAGLSGCVETKLDQKALDRSLRQAAIVAESKANYLAAASHYRKLWAGEAASDDVLLGLLRNLRYTGASTEALALAKRNAQAFERNIDFQIEYGKVVLSSGDAAGAVKRLGMALSLNRGNWRIFATLGIAYDQVKAYGSARRAYEMALQLSPDNAVVMNNFAISLALAGNVDEAIKVTKRAANLARRNVQIRQNLALFLGIKGQLRDAEALARMDLDDEAVRNNLSVYQGFQGKGIARPSK